MAELRDGEVIAPAHIVLSGILSVADVMHAQRLAIRAFRVRTILLFVLPVLLLTSLLLTGFEMRPRSPFLVAQILLFLYCIATPLAVVIGYVRRYLYYRRQSHLQQGVFAPTTTVIAPDGMTTKSEHAESRIRWTLFRGFRESDRVIVLYLQFPNQFLIVSRGKLEDQNQWHSLTALVEHQLPRI